MLELTFSVTQNPLELLVWDSNLRRIIRHTYRVDVGFVVGGTGVIPLHIRPEPQTEHIGGAVIDHPGSIHFTKRLYVLNIPVVAGDVGNPSQP